MAKKWLTQFNRVQTARLSIRRVVPMTAAAMRRISPCGLIQRLERGGVDQREIVDPQRIRRRPATACRVERCGDRRAAEDRVARGIECIRKRDRPPPFVRREKAIARGQREAVRLAHRWHTHDLDRQVEVGAIRRITASC